MELLPGQAKTIVCPVLNYRVQFISTAVRDRCSKEPNTAASEGFHSIKEADVRIVQLVVWENFDHDTAGKDDVAGLEGVKHKLGDRQSLSDQRVGDKSEALVFKEDLGYLGATWNVKENIDKVQYGEKELRESVIEINLSSLISPI